MDEVLSPQMSGFDDDDSLLAVEQKLTTNAKKVALMTLGTAAQKYMMKLGDQQEVLMGIADIIMDTYAMETAILRARKLTASQGEGAAERYLDMTRVFCNDAVERIEAKAKNTLAGMSEGDELRTLLAALRRFTKLQPMNTIAARQRIANDLMPRTSTSIDCQLPISISDLKRQAISKLAIGNWQSAITVAQCASSPFHCPSRFTSARQRLRDREDPLTIIDNGPKTKEAIEALRRVCAMRDSSFRSPTHRPDARSRGPCGLARSLRDEARTRKSSFTIGDWASDSTSRV